MNRCGGQSTRWSLTDPMIEACQKRETRSVRLRSRLGRHNKIASCSSGVVNTCSQADMLELMFVEVGRDRLEDQCIGFESRTAISRGKSSE